MSNNYKTASDELGKRLVTLYKKKIFPRMGREMAQNLYDNGLEAGALLRSLGNITDADYKLQTAVQALIKLNGVNYAAEVMVAGGFYTQATVTPLTGYVEKLMEAITKLIDSVKHSKPKVEHKQPAAASPVVHRQVIVQPTPQPVVYGMPYGAQPVYSQPMVYAPQNAPAAEPKREQPYRDPDGFDDPA